MFCTLIRSERPRCPTQRRRKCYVRDDVQTDSGRRDAVLSSPQSDSWIGRGSSTRASTAIGRHRVLPAAGVEVPPLLPSKMSQDAELPRAL